MGTTDTPMRYSGPLDLAHAHTRFNLVTDGAEGFTRDGPPGSWGKLMRSRDHGAHWEDAKLPGALESSAWCVATNSADPKLIFAATALGQYFRSQDGGETWTALPRRLTETRALAWVPA